LKHKNEINSNFGANSTKNRAMMQIGVRWKTNKWVERGFASWPKLKAMNYGRGTSLSDEFQIWPCCKGKGKG
jgi:hypothetical protein